MQHTITINEREFLYTLKRRKYQRRINMIVHQDGTFIVTASKMTPLLSIEKILHKNAAWVYKNLGHREQLQITVDPLVIKHIKKATRRLVHKKLKHFNTHYNYTYHRVAIRAQSTVWGSCSAKGNLNFNYKIFALPEYLQDYVIVHELCHLEELNHSKDFWHLVAQMVPTYKTDRKELKMTTV